MFTGTLLVLLRSVFSRQQLQKLHRRFSHPSADRLYKMLKNARPDETSQNTLDILENLTRRCDVCQRIQSAPVRSRVSFDTENLRFNEEIYMDVMYIGHARILHVVDALTRFSAALSYQMLIQRPFGLLL